MIIVTNENVNGIVDYSVSMVDSIVKDKKYPGKLKNAMYLVLISYIIEYGYEKIEDIYQTFSTTKFTMTNIPLGEYLNTRADLKDGKIKIDPNVAKYAPAITLSSLSGRLDKPEFYDEIIISTEMDMDLLCWIEALAHEINHLFTSQKGRIFTINDRLFIRNGLYSSEILNKEIKEKGRTFNECINSLQTESLVQNILELYGLRINNSFVSSTLENIKYGSGKKYEASGYVGLLPLYRDLYNNRHFNAALNDGFNNGDIISLESDFDKHAGDGSYEKILDFSDKMFSFIVYKQPDFMISYAVSQMNAIINIYLQNTDSKKY